MHKSSDASFHQSSVFCVYECAGIVVKRTTATVNARSRFFLITESF